MIDVGMPPEKMLVLHNGYDQSDMEPVLSKMEARTRIGLDANAFYVVYTGNMQANKGIESLIDMAQHCPEMQFVMVGGTHEDIARLKSYAAANAVQNLIWTGRLPIAQVSEYLYAADVLVIPPVSAPLQKFGRTVLPFKVFPYLASGRAILAPSTPDIQELMVHRKNALLVKPDQLDDAVNALKELYDKPLLLNDLGVAAKKSGEELTWEARARKFANWLQKIA